MADLVVDHISKGFRKGWFTHRQILAVDDVSLELSAGRTLGLVGMSGSGKSTLARLVTGLLRPDSGRIMLAGEEVSKGAGIRSGRAARRIQMLFQHPTSALNPRFRMQESMEEPLRLHPDLLAREQWQAAIEEQMEFVALDTSLLSRYPHQLSGGQLQRFCIARLLLLKPQVLVLDEPTSMLDVSVQAQVMDLLARVQQEQGISYLFISHDLDLVRAYSDEIAVMYHGKIVEQAAVEDLYRQPQHAYTKELIAAFTQI